jgi:MFS family permease
MRIPTSSALPSAPEISMSSALLAVFAAALGYGLVLPILPALIARTPGADLAVGTGSMMAAFTLAVVVASPFWGWLLDRWSSRLVLILGLSGQGLALAALAIPASLSTLHLIRATQGALAAAVIPAALLAVTRTTAPEAHGQAVSRVSRAALLGALAGPAVGGLFANGADLFWPILIASLLSLAAIVIAHLSTAARLRDDPSGTKPSPPDPVAAPGVTLARLASGAIVAGLAMGSMEVGVAVRGREAFALGSAGVGLMISACSVVMIAAQLLVFRPRRQPATLWRLLAPSFLLSALALAMLGFGDLRVLALVVVLVGAGGGVLLPVISLWIVRAARHGVHGFYLGLSSALNALGQAMGALSAAMMYRSQSPHWLLVMVVVMVVAATAWLLQRLPARATVKPTWNPDSIHPGPMRHDNGIR